MCKIIEINVAEITIGKEDGTCVTLPAPYDFHPMLDQQVELYTKADGKIIVAPVVRYYRTSLIFRFVRWLGFTQIFQYLIAPLITKKK